jgi:hypothetical protein
MPKRKTPLADRRAILALMWEDDREHPDLQALFEYGDIGFPLASCIQRDIVPQTLQAEKYIDDLWQYVLDFFGVEDSGKYHYWWDIADQAADWECVQGGLESVWVDKRRGASDRP